MTRLMIELDGEQERRLQEIATRERRSARDLCHEAIEHFLQERGNPNGDPYDPLRRMIGLVKKGPTDASVHHDVRPGDEE